MVQNDDYGKRLYRQAISSLTNQLGGPLLETMESNITVVEIIQLFDLPQAAFEPDILIQEEDAEPVVDLSLQLGPRYCSAVQLLSDTILDPENQLMLDCGPRFETLLEQGNR